VNPCLEINGRRIGTGHPCYIVAEISANHNQKIDQALKLVGAAKEAGADAVKIQTYTPDTLTLNSDQIVFRIGEDSLWGGRTLYELYSQAYMPWEWTDKLKAAAEDAGLDFFSTAFDPTSVDFLEAIGVPVYKIASFEIVDLPLIEKVAATGKPLIMSTGMATLGEIEDAVQTARSAGAAGVALLKCTSAYPSLPEEINLRTIPHLSAAFHVVVGVSDHTLGGVVPAAAVALGACIVEKHFTMARTDGGPDSSFSLEPHEFREMVFSVRIAEKALGDVHYGVTEKESKNRVFRRSLFAVRDIKKGEAFTTENVRSVRPSAGISPKLLPEVLGRRATCDISFGTPLQLKHLAEP
jgi:N-acetylneuraminate synthase